MKKFNYCSYALIVALGFTTFAGCETTGSGASSSTSPASTMASADSGRLVIKRVANIGTSLVLNVSIDGKFVASVAQGSNLQRLIVSRAACCVGYSGAEWNEFSSHPKAHHRSKGQTYTFTATWDGSVLALL